LYRIFNEKYSSLFGAVLTSSSNRWYSVAADVARFNSAVDEVAEYYLILLVMIMISFVVSYERFAFAYLSALPTTDRFTS